MRIPADPSLGAVGAGSNAGPHFCMGPHAQHPALSGRMSGFISLFDSFSPARSAGYCNATRGIPDALTNRLTRKHRELFPLLERIDKAA